MTQSGSKKLHFHMTRAPATIRPAFVLTLAFCEILRGICTLRVLARTLGKHRDTQPPLQSTNPNPGGHGIYVCLRTFRRQVIRQSCHIAFFSWMRVCVCVSVWDCGGCVKKKNWSYKKDGKMRGNKCKNFWREHNCVLDKWTSQEEPLPLTLINVRIF